MHTATGLGPGEAMRRAVKLRSNLVKRRTSILARLDALLEMLGPGWHSALNADLANKTPLRFLAHYAEPHLFVRLGWAPTDTVSTVTPATAGQSVNLTSGRPRHADIIHEPDARPEHFSRCPALSRSCAIRATT
ncbi:hypothetical protein [Nocardia terpenica]|uniref:Uncharacterized protein n=1 Tax=Nocardia terpenica TaxID=455432 RepID=A0A6G9ZF01_9NOCA|nr:hypothetical protein [Nocardia terpenica]QIS23563.1 hypothetical protein F6W96_40075 [Nocardia terpenica]